MVAVVTFLTLESVITKNHINVTTFLWKSGSKGSYENNILKSSRLVCLSVTCFQMRPPIFIREYVRGYVGPWVCGSVGPWVRPSVMRFFSMRRLWDYTVGNDEENCLNAPSSLKSLPNCPKMSQLVPKCPIRTHRPNRLVSYKNV